MNFSFPVIKIIIWISYLFLDVIFLFLLFVSQYWPLYRRRFGSYIVDVPFSSHIYQQYFSFIFAVIRIGLWNSYRSVLEELTRFITLNFYSLKIFFLNDCSQLSIKFSVSTSDTNVYIVYLCDIGLLLPLCASSFTFLFIVV